MSATILALETFLLLKNDHSGAFSFPERWGFTSLLMFSCLIYGCKVLKIPARNLTF